MCWQFLITTHFIQITFVKWGFYTWALKVMPHVSKVFGSKGFILDTMRMSNHTIKLQHITPWASLANDPGKPKVWYTFLLWKVHFKPPRHDDGIETLGLETQKKSALDFLNRLIRRESYDIKKVETVWGQFCRVRILCFHISHLCMNVCLGINSYWWSHEWVVVRIPCHVQAEKFVLHTLSTKGYIQLHGYSSPSTCGHGCVWSESKNSLFKAHVELKSVSWL